MDLINKFIKFQASGDIYFIQKINKNRIFGKHCLTKREWYYDEEERSGIFISKKYLFLFTVLSEQEVKEYLLENL